jgi:hypothetical protein
MARIVVVTHEFDIFAWRERFWKPRGSFYLLFHVLEALKSMGHSWRISAGPRAPAADAVILHVNATLVPEDYPALAERYRVAINFQTGDISKRRGNTGLLLKRGDNWSGRVIVKTDLNFFGRPEARINAVAEARGRPRPFPAAPNVDVYPILDSIALVPDAVWDNDRLVVQRFLPETDPDGYALRTWVFAGSRGRCNRHVSPAPIVKADQVVSRRPAEVPDAIRAERERLGFDFGKFDFVVHEGEAILLDANRTPGTAPTLDQYMSEGARNLAEGLVGLIER